MIPTQDLKERIDRESDLIWGNYVVQKLLKEIEEKDNEIEMFQRIVDTKNEIEIDLHKEIERITNIHWVQETYKLRIENSELKEKIKRLEGGE